MKDEREDSDSGIEIIQFWILDFGFDFSLKKPIAEACPQSKI